MFFIFHIKYDRTYQILLIIRQFSSTLFKQIVKLK
jgi:hypothetical protein